jgi:2,3-dihydroxybiphenyl 1,2-dioxygenase
VERAASLGLGYIGLNVPDVDAWNAFASEVIGLAPSRGRETAPADSGVQFKADDHSWRLALHRSDTPGIRYAGFEYSSRQSFDLAVARLQKEGFEPRAATGTEIAVRGVQDLVHLRDPSGVRIELYWGPNVDGRFVSPAGVERFVTGELGLGHYVLFVSDLERSEDFYIRGLGMELTGVIEVDANVSVHFLRMTRRHHSVAFTAAGPFDALHHLMLEVPDIDQVGWALERAVRAGCEITASLGRHKNDRMLSFYMRSPAGFEVEIGCDGRLIDDGWVVNRFSDGDEWGHHGLTAEAMIDSVKAQD